MIKWLLTCSVDATDIDYEEIITADSEPGFWECYEIAEGAGCEFWCLARLEE